MAGCRVMARRSWWESPGKGRGEEGSGRLGVWVGRDLLLEPLHDGS